MTKREFKNKVYSELATITKALANPHRLEIVELLAQGHYSVEQISIQTELSIANASQHLQVLKSAQLVEVTREGNFIYYRLANSNVFKAWKALRDLGVERIASVERLVRDFRKQKAPSSTVTIQDLVAKIESRKVTVLDVRPGAEYKAGHIKDAISIPYDQLPGRMDELPKRKEIVTYCRGPFCAFADDAVELLNKAGFRATRLEEGFPDWKILNLPIDVN